MQGKEIKYFEWLDIQSEICKEMDIDEQYFTKYHEVIGGINKDLWHEYIKYFDEVIKDTIKKNDLGDCIESKLQWVRDDDKEWLEPFVRAVYKVWDDNNIEYVRYFW